MTHIGVLAMQGAFAEHVRALRACGVDAFEVRTLAQLAACDAIVIPGGESTAIRKALDRCDLLAPLQELVDRGMPALGTCAGMIVLADTAPDGAPACFGVLDIDVERNGWGRQVHSAELDVTYDDGTVARAVFIRAPRITRVGSDVSIIATVAGASGMPEPVAVRQGHLLAAAFHPELTGDRHLHERFVELVRERQAAAGAASPA